MDPLAGPVLFDPLPKYRAHIGAPVIVPTPPLEGTSTPRIKVPKPPSPLNCARELAHPSATSRHAMATIRIFMANSRN